MNLRTWLFVLALIPAILGGAQAQMLPLPSPTVVLTPTAADDAETYYRQALSSYLDGDYDKAIVYTAQSLEKDSSYEKSKNLLALLSAEKDNEGKTVIWLAGKHTAAEPPPAVAQDSSLPSPDLSHLQSEIDTVKAQEDNNRRVQTIRANQLAGQLEVIHDMVSMNSSGQFQELKNSQAELYQQFLKMGSERWGNLLWLILLCLLSVALSLYSLWTARHKKRATH